MDNGSELSSSWSFASSSYESDRDCIHDEPGTRLDLLSLSKLSGNLEKLVLNAEYDYSDAEIVVDGITVGVNRCILAARSQFFHKKFKDNENSVKEGKPKYLLKDLLPGGSIGYEAFMVFLNYLYTGKLKPPPPEVSTCVDITCTHDACRPAINYAVELMYAFATFQIKELVMAVQRHLVNLVDEATVDDVIPILLVAFHCSLDLLLERCVQKVERSDLDIFTLEKELPSKVLTDIKARRLKSQIVIEQDTMEGGSLHEKRIRKILKALESDDIELLKLLLGESNVTLNDACALHYAAAYCNSKVVNEVLKMGIADVNLRNSRGYTVLHVGARRMEPSIIMSLLDKGASALDTTLDGLTALSICLRVTRLKDYNETAKEGEITNKDRLCIDVLEREMNRNPMIGNISTSSSVVADDLLAMLLLLENRVAMARMMFPIEAKLAMDIAHVESTSEFTGLSEINDLCGDLTGVVLNGFPPENVKGLQERLAALQKTGDQGGEPLRNW
ncbi:BTB/POZ domain and ankyrin repeat-containing protein NPR1 isoform X2 [Nicotiana tabacum]|uniref:BTB/POZ domain and ankyrin repeat-containing protein NPR1 isoform X2 n=3 Tax=Nicotiana TaxID=4085 RepID=A0AC58S980_TOBAC|nr:PREDICTED: regulatory protein NPR3-like isoform X2 [Nicotiana sylvestris]XP_016513502.1 PREDICTED: regulatory protein NPR3-like isoform X2 [Nicotiana tabacum]